MQCIHMGVMCRSGCYLQQLLSCNPPSSSLVRLLQLGSTSEVMADGHFHFLTKRSDKVLCMAVDDLMGLSIEPEY